MARVKRGNVSRKRHKKVLNRTKGFVGALSKLYRPAHQAMLHALSYSFRHRRAKKGDFRKLWIARISAALTETPLSYSKFIGLCSKSNIELNRKMLAEIALSNPKHFEKIVNEVSK